MSNQFSAISSSVSDSFSIANQRYSEQEFINSWFKSGVNIPYWNRLLKVVFSSIGGLKIKGFIEKGGDGNVFSLERVTLKRVTGILKLPHAVSRPLFDPNRGAHLVSCINNPGICSPTHFFYLTPQNTLSLTPSLESECVAMVMPYVRGVSLELKMQEIAERADRIFHFGLRLAEALYELSRHRIEHGDLHHENILINEAFEPIIIDFDRSRRVATVSTVDYAFFRRHLVTLIFRSEDIKSVAKTFLLEYLHKHSTPGDIELPRMPLRMVALTRCCIDHLNAIRISETAFAPMTLERGIQAYLDDFDPQHEVSEPFHTADSGAA